MAEFDLTLLFLTIFLPLLLFISSYTIIILLGYVVIRGSLSCYINKTFTTTTNSKKAVNRWQTMKNKLIVHYK